MYKFDLLRIRDLLTTFLFASFIIFNNSEYSSISVLGLSVGLLVLHTLYTLCSSGQGLLLRIDSVHKRMLLFDVFCFLSAIWAYNAQSSFQDGISIFENIVCVSIVYMCYENDESINRLKQTVKYGGVVAALYIIFHYGLSDFISMASTSTRLGGDIGNANSIGYFMALSLIIFVYDLLQDGFRITSVIGVLPLIILTSSQSRTALLSLLLGGIILSILLGRNNRGNLMSFLKILGGLVVIGIVLWFLSTKTSLIGGISNRINEMFLALGGHSVSEGSFSERMTYITGGFAMFLKHPIVGVGIGNSYVVTNSLLGYSTYLHNNYIELLVCGGLIGFICYYSIFFTAFNEIRKINKVTVNDGLLILCIIILVMMLFEDVGRVSYYKKETYFLLMMIYMAIRQSKYDYYDLQ